MPKKGYQKDKKPRRNKQKPSLVGSQGPNTQVSSSEESEDESLNKSSIIQHKGDEDAPMEESHSAAKHAEEIGRNKKSAAERKVRKNFDVIDDEGPGVPGYMQPTIASELRERAT